MNNIKLRKIKCRFAFIAAIFFAALFYCSYDCFALDSEAVYSIVDVDNITPPKDIVWHSRVYNATDNSGNKIKYVLSNKRVKVYINNELTLVSDSNVLVQDLAIADTNEIIMLLWKQGKYGVNKPFIVGDIPCKYSQHIFMYNICNKTFIPSWGCYHMKNEAIKLEYMNDRLFVTHVNGDEAAYIWNGKRFEKSKPISLMAAGDNLIHDFIYEDALKNHNGDFEYIYKKVEKYTRQADISIINLETPLVKNPSMYSTYPSFGSPIMVAEGIKKAEFDAVTLSNNHRLDKGVIGITETLETLDSNKLLHTGSMDDKPYLIIEKAGIKFAFMSYTYGTNGIKPPKGYENAVNFLDDEEKVRNDIKEAKKEADFIIVCPHWGAEYTYEPNYYEIKWRDIFYDEGVDVVLGTHPHVIQKYEMYKAENSDHEMLVYYSLGNYISGNQRPDHNSGGLALFSVDITSHGPGISTYSFVPIDTIYKMSKYN